MTDQDKQITCPSRTWFEEQRETGAFVRLLWEVPGMAEMGVAWLSCYTISRGGDRSRFVIVKTFKHDDYIVLMEI